MSLNSLRKYLLASTLVCLFVCPELSGANKVQMLDDKSFGLLFDEKKSTQSTEWESQANEFYNQLKQWQESIQKWLSDLQNLYSPVIKNINQESSRVFITTNWQRANNAFAMHVNNFVANAAKDWDSGEYYINLVKSYNQLRDSYRQLYDWYIYKMYTKEGSDQYTKLNEEANAIHKLFESIKKNFIKLCGFDPMNKKNAFYVRSGTNSNLNLAYKSEYVKPIAAAYEYTGESKKRKDKQSELMLITKPSGTGADGISLKTGAHLKKILKEVEPRVKYEFITYVTDIYYDSKNGSQFGRGVKPDDIGMMAEIKVTLINNIDSNRKAYLRERLIELISIKLRGTKKIIDLDQLNRLLSNLQTLCQLIYRLYPGTSKEDYVPEFLELKQEIITELQAIPRDQPVKELEPDLPLGSVNPFGGIVA